MTCLAQAQPVRYLWPEQMAGAIVLPGKGYRGDVLVGLPGRSFSGVGLLRLARSSYPAFALLALGIFSGSYWLIPFGCSGMLIALVLVRLNHSACPRRLALAVTRLLGAWLPAAPILAMPSRRLLLRDWQRVHGRALAAPPGGGKFPDKRKLPAALVFAAVIPILMLPGWATLRHPGCPPGVFHRFDGWSFSA